VDHREGKSKVNRAIEIGEALWNLAEPRGHRPGREDRPALQYCEHSGLYLNDHQPAGGAR
jgi:hypothetical protein